jgi:hypothetical protein
MNKSESLRRAAECKFPVGCPASESDNRMSRFWSALRSGPRAVS